MTSLPSELEILRRHPSWVVASHMNPDGDTLGSAIAMKQLLRALGHRVVHLCPDPVPACLRFLPGADEVLTELPADLPTDTGLVTLDAADASRFGQLNETFATMHPLVVVDHHVSNPRFGDVNIILTDAAATGEVVYRLFQHFGLPIDPESAWGMYVAIVTDTGSFRYEGTKAETLEMAADLIRAGADPSRISKALYEQVPPSELKIKAMALARLTREGPVAWTTITRQMLAEADATEDQTDGLAEALRALAGVEVSFFLRETDRGTLKASLRSKDVVDVARIASQFGGGGHKRAAGCTIPGSLEQASRRLLEAIGRELAASYAIGG